MLDAIMSRHVHAQDASPAPAPLLLPGQVDGFRFDIMGHLMVSTMKTAQAALAALTPGADGVDGGAIYLYGEAWDFGEVRALTQWRTGSFASACLHSLGPW